jgi:phage/plasmid-associated DNA primase
MDIWEDFLADVLPDTELRGFVQRLAGYGYLAGDAVPVLGVFVGTGPNGKTTLARALHVALGISVVERCPEFAPRRFTILTTNQLPRVPYKALVVPFTEEFPPSRRDPKMLERLRERDTWRAIRSWAHDGYLDFIAQGLNPPL